MKSRAMTHRVFLLNPKKLLIVLLVFLTVAFLFQEKTVRQTKAQGNTYYVPGDFPTIQAAVNAAQPGNQVLVNSGTYNERVSSARSGNSQNYISIKANGNVTMKGFSLNHNYITVDGFEITDTSGGGVSMRGNYLKVLNNNIHHINGTCITVSGTNNLLEGNDISHAFGGEADGIRFFGQGHIIRNNYIHDIINAEAPGSHVDCFQTYDNSRPESTRNILIEDNICLNVDHQCIMASASTQRQGSDLTFQRNVCGNNGGQAVFVVDIPNSIIRNNVFLPTIKWRAVVFWGVAYNGQVFNNIFYMSNTAPPYDSYSNTEFYSDYNLKYPNTGTRWNEPHSIWGVDPMFVNPGNHNYHLQPGSPACGSGRDGVDMGIYEYDCTSPPPTSPTPTSTPTPLPGLSWEAEDGAITSPFSVSNGYVSQSVWVSDPSQGGKALYQFTITTPGDYVVKAVVDASDDGSNSFLVNIDSEPTTPTMIWDIDITNGFEERTVSWRGSGTPDASEFVPKVFTLSAGEHELIIRGREGNTRLNRVSVVPLANPSWVIYLPVVAD